MTRSTFPRSVSFLRESGIPRAAAGENGAAFAKREGGEGTRTNESDGRGRVEEKIAREDLRITVDSRRSARTAQCAMGNTAHRLLTFHALFFLAANRRGRDRSGP